MLQLTKETSIEQDASLHTSTSANLARCLRLMQETKNASIGKLSCTELIHILKVEKDLDFYMRIWDKCIKYKEEKTKEACFRHFDKLRTH